MSTEMIPQEWASARLAVRDSTLDDVPALQHIYQAVPHVRDWMGAAEEGVGFVEVGFGLGFGRGGDAEGVGADGEVCAEPPHDRQAYQADHQA